MSLEMWIVTRNIAIVAIIFALLWTLAVLLCREWVKSDLRDRILTPIHIRWRPFSWRTNWLTCAFRVEYSDLNEKIHRATCWTYWYRREVTWETDETVG